MRPRTPALIETVRIRGGVAPLFYLHVRRLVASSRALGLPFPTELIVPSGGADRAWRLELGPGGVTVTEREVGSLAPVRLVSSRVIHQPYPHKTTEREPFDVALAGARRAGADDALLLTREGYVAEGAVSCLFWWEGERLCAPALDLGILPGVSRARIEEVLGPVAERRVGLEPLQGRGLLVANAVRGVLPVATLDGREVPQHPGTEELMARFWT